MTVVIVVNMCNSPQNQGSKVLHHSKTLLTKMLTLTSVPLKKQDQQTSQNAGDVGAFFNSVESEFEDIHDGNFLCF